MSKGKGKGKSKGKSKGMSGWVELVLFPTHAKGRHMWAT